ncbi:MAG: hypothetical protein V3G42_03055 [Oscillospiraceae bacterium]
MCYNKAYSDRLSNEGSPVKLRRSHHYRYSRVARTGEYIASVIGMEWRSHLTADEKM